MLNSYDVFVATDLLWQMQDTVESRVSNSSAWLKMAILENIANITKMPNVKPNLHHAIFLHRNNIVMCDVEFDALSIGVMQYKIQ